MFPVMTPLAFLHIPKTGGSSIAIALYQAFGAGQVLRVWDKAHGAKVTPRGFSRARLDGYAAVAGHLTYAQLVRHPAYRHAPPPFVFSVVRDPVERALSLFNYLRGEGPADTALAEFETMVAAMPRDRQCAFLSAPGVAPEDLARHHHIVPYEHLTDGLDAALAVHGASRSAPLPRINAPRRRRLSAADLTPDTIEMIRRHSPRDLALHRMLLTHRMDAPPELPDPAAPAPTPRFPVGSLDPARIAAE